ncbi:MAG TPA: hypothetical protein VL752_17820 [Acidisoma sp.]|jgi:hypothetical protein|uniref:hypothetical protein n=1 Tax=Acidisoma sp. TaxID=1872115 RepID=UPI002B7A2359|nr:hypothetical protein [Acidisoma sp.]HTI02810.1 hypothetical protein [Acidisoma sp.]
MSQSERQASARPQENRVQELRASAHLMTLETGIFCLVNGSGKGADGQITGVRVSATDPADSNVAIATFRPDGWLTGAGDSALIRVLQGPTQILITIYQPTGSQEGPPKLRVLRLSEAGPAEAGAASPAAAATRPPVMILNEKHDVIAHIQSTGDVGRHFGEWVGEPGNQRAIEGFSLATPEGLTAADLTYQAVLGRGWLSPWVEAGQFCGSRGMALPILGFKLKLSEAAARRFDLQIAASFVDGTRLEGLGTEDSCEAPSLAPLEALQITLTAKGGAKQKPAAAKPAAAKPETPKATAKPAAKIAPKAAARPKPKTR